ncbi:MAG: SRPBCC family protein [Bacteroidota bacterium]
MPRLEIHTKIRAPQELVFDLARSIDLHEISTEHTGERAIGGRTTGLIGRDEIVTWRARHFGIYQTLTSKITAFERPHFFVDEMQKGIFKAFRHEHHFATLDNTTLMTDSFTYTSPYGVFGQLADMLFLRRYMTRFLIKRNRTVQKFAESDQWQTLIP